MMGCPVENNPRHCDSPSFENIGDVVRIFQCGARWYANFQWEGKQQRPSLKTTGKKEACRRAIRLEAEILEGRFTESVRAPSVKAVTDAYVAYMKSEGRAKKTFQKIELVAGQSDTNSGAVALQNEVQHPSATRRNDSQKRHKPLRSQWLVSFLRFPSR